MRQTNEQRLANELKNSTADVLRNDILNGICISKNAVELKNFLATIPLTVDTIREFYCSVDNIIKENPSAYPAYNALALQQLLIAIFSKKNTGGPSAAQLQFIISGEEDALNLQLKNETVKASIDSYDAPKTDKYDHLVLVLAQEGRLSNLFYLQLYSSANCGIFFQGVPVLLVLMQNISLANMRSTSIESLIKNGYKKTHDQNKFREALFKWMLENLNKFDSSIFAKIIITFPKSKRSLKIHEGLVALINAGRYDFTYYCLKSSAEELLGSYRSLRIKLQDLVDYSKLISLKKIYCNNSEALECLTRLIVSDPKRNEQNLEIPSVPDHFALPRNLFPKETAKIAPALPTPYDPASYNELYHTALLTREEIKQQILNGSDEQKRHWMNCIFSTHLNLEGKYSKNFSDFNGINFHDPLKHAITNKLLCEDAHMKLLLLLYSDSESKDHFFISHYLQLLKNLLRSYGSNNGDTLSQCAWEHVLKKIPFGEIWPYAFDRDDSFMSMGAIRLMLTFYSFAIYSRINKYYSLDRCLNLPCGKTLFKTQPDCVSDDTIRADIEFLNTWHPDNRGLFLSLDINFNAFRPHIWDQILSESAKIKSPSELMTGDFVHFVPCTFSDYFDGGLKGYMSLIESCATQLFKNEIQIQTVNNILSCLFDDIMKNPHFLFYDWCESGLDNPLNKHYPVIKKLYSESNVFRNIVRCARVKGNYSYYGSHEYPTLQDAEFVITSNGTASTPGNPETNYALLLISAHEAKKAGNLEMACVDRDIAISLKDKKTMPVLEETSAVRFIGGRRRHILAENVGPEEELRDMKIK